MRASVNFWPLPGISSSSTSSSFGGFGLRLDRLRVDGEQPLRHFDGSAGRGGGRGRRGTRSGRRIGRVCGDAQTRSGEDRDEPLRLHMRHQCHGGHTRVPCREFPAAPCRRKPSRWRATSSANAWCTPTPRAVSRDASSKPRRIHPAIPTGYARPGLTTSNAPLFDARGIAYVRMVYGTCLTLNLARPRRRRSAPPC